MGGLPAKWVRLMQIYGRGRSFAGKPAPTSLVWVWCRFEVLRGQPRSHLFIMIPASAVIVAVAASGIVSVNIAIIVSLH